MYLTPSPTSFIRYGEEIVEHLRSQPVKRWCGVTLQYPRWKSRKRWDVALKRTFVELEHRILRNKLLRENLATGATSIRRVITLGGNVDDDNRKLKALHAQGLIDGIADDACLVKALTKAWRNNVRRLVEKDGYSFYEQEAKVWLDELSPDLDAYVYYVLRLESKFLGAGLDKILSTESGISYLTGTPPALKAA